jgi:hypothetical protein
MKTHLLGKAIVIRDPHKYPAGTFECTHTCTHNLRVMSHRSGSHRLTHCLPSSNSSCISGDPQLWAPSSTGAGDNDNIMSFSSSGLGKVPPHKQLLAGMVSSHRQWGKGPPPRKQWLMAVGVIRDEGGRKEFTP